MTTIEAYGSIVAALHGNTDVLPVNNSIAKPAKSDYVG